MNNVDSGPDGSAAVAAVVARMMDDVKLLVRQECELAILETTQRNGGGARRVDPAVVAACAAGASGALAAAAGLALEMPLWLAATIVCGASIAVAVGVRVRESLIVRPAHGKRDRRAEAEELEAVRRWAYERGGR